MDDLAAAIANRMANATGLDEPYKERTFWFARENFDDIPTIERGEGQRDVCAAKETMALRCLADKLLGTEEQVHYDVENSAGIQSLALCQCLRTLNWTRPVGESSCEVAPDVGSIVFYLRERTGFWEWYDEGMVSLDKSWDYLVDKALQWPYIQVRSANDEEETWDACHTVAGRLSLGIYECRPELLDRVSILVNYIALRGMFKPGENDQVDKIIEKYRPTVRQHAVFLDNLGGVGVRKPIL
ncbi:hypothetical protein S40288_11683 [Stachybotrys chartarum IBT 40288]|nr:hypothetical protein S40288_11683 [Stachybotrys chartarum IBT 40288]